MIDAAALFRPGRRAQLIFVRPHLLSPKWPFEELFESRTVLPWVSQPSQTLKTAPEHQARAGELIKAIDLQLLFQFPL